MRDLRVLIADDEALVREAAARKLERTGFDLISSVSGEQALEPHKEHRKDIAFVVLELIMSGISGVETCEGCASKMRAPGSR